jgi:hypothetical protein
LVEKRAEEGGIEADHLPCHAEFLYLGHGSKTSVPKAVEVIREGFVNAAHRNREPIPAIDLALE